MKLKITGLVAIMFLSAIALGCVDDQDKSLTENQKNLKIGEKYFFKNAGENAEFSFEVKDVMFSTEYHTLNVMNERRGESKIGYQFLWVYVIAVNTGDTVIELPHATDIYAIVNGKKFDEYAQLYQTLELYEINGRNITGKEIFPENYIVRQGESKEGWWVGIEIPDKYENLQIWMVPSTTSKYYPSFSGQSAVWIINE